MKLSFTRLLSVSKLFIVPTSITTVINYELKIYKLNTPVIKTVIATAT